jgi:VWFA-related protein
VRKTILPFLVAVFAILLTGNVFAADPVQLKVNEVQEHIGGMTVNFTAMDDTGQESALTTNDVQVALGGKQLTADSIEKTNYGRQPASVVLLVDTSGSMYGNPIVQAQAAVRDFIAQLEPDDRIALMSFSTSVSLLQDFTSDRSVLDSAVSGLRAFGDTALYDAVNAAISQANTAPEGSKLVVILSDGVATQGLENRDPSVAAAEQAGTRVIAVGLGPSVDVDYLRALTSRTGGRYIPAASADQLRTAYADVAESVVHRYFSDYTMQVTVPPTIDRTVDGTLTVTAKVRDEEASVQQALGPLEGAVPPPYEVQLSGLAAGGELKDVATMGVVAPEGRDISTVEYLLDGNVVASGDAASTYALAASALKTGTYKFAVKTVDSKGGQGYGEISFLVPPPAAAPQAGSGGSSFPVTLLLLLVVGGGVAYALYRVIQKRLAMAPEYAIRSLTPEPGERLEKAHGSEEPSARPARQRAATIALANSGYRGRIIVMHESAIMAGDLNATQEYEVGEAPLTVGTGKQADIVLEDDSGLISEEEARVWVHRGRITYHRLTALSSMATSGITSGWEFFDNGDEMRLGGYRFIFQVQVNEDEPQEEEPAPGSLPQEHGMTLRRSEPFGWDNR